jgi:hypothetical protein
VRLAGGVGRSVGRDFWRPRATALSLSDWAARPFTRRLRHYARAARGHAAAPPSSVMNSRRLMSDMARLLPSRSAPALKSSRSQLTTRSKHRALLPRQRTAQRTGAWRPRYSGDVTVMPQNTPKSNVVCWTPCDQPGAVVLGADPDPFIRSQFLRDASRVAAVGDAEITACLVSTRQSGHAT